MSNAPGCVLMTNIPAPEFFAELRTIVKEEITRENIQDDAEKLLSVRETCGLFKISRPTLKRLEQAGRIQSIRIGGRIFYRKGDMIQGANSYKKFSHSKAHQNEQPV